MNRNMLRRIELAWPVTDPVLRQRLIDECLVAYLHDGRDAWDLEPDGSYQPRRQGHACRARRAPRAPSRPMARRPRSWTATRRADFAAPHHED